MKVIFRDTAHGAQLCKAQVPYPLTVESVSALSSALDDKADATVRR